MSIKGLIIFNAIYLYIVYFIILFNINVMFRFGIYSHKTMEY